MGRRKPYSSLGMMPNSKKAFSARKTIAPIGKQELLNERIIRD